MFYPMYKPYVDRADQIRWSQYADSLRDKYSWVLSDTGWDFQVRHFSPWMVFSVKGDPGPDGRLYHIYAKVYEDPTSAEVFATMTNILKAILKRASKNSL